MPALPLSRRALAALALVFALPALAEDWPDTDWPRAQQPAGPALEAFERYAFGRRDDVRRKGIRTDAVVVIRDGRLVYERYAGPSRAETPHLTWSVSKSLLATLLGVAEGEGRFQLDDPVARYYPPFARHPEVTLRHLLNWSSGLDWQEDYEFAPLKSSVVAMLYTRGRDDMAGFVAETPQARPPGRRFRYSSGDSNVLAAALHGMLGADYAEYPWRALFEPLGIRSAVWERDAAGTFVGSSYVYMSARDLARVGLLMQRHGRWRERQIAAAGMGRVQPDTLRPLPAERGRGGRGGAGRPVVVEPCGERRAGALAGRRRDRLRRARPLGPGALRAARGEAGDRALRRRPRRAFPPQRIPAPGTGGVRRGGAAMIRRHPLLFLFVLGLLAALAWAWQNRIHLAAFPAIIGAYTAKEYCSCRYVMGNSADYCRAYTQQYVPISGFFDDEARRRVTARGLGSTQTAAWLGPREGCRLMPEADRLPD